MVDVKQAVQIARDKAAEVLGVDGSIEEIERETYHDRDAWSITLGVPRNVEQLSTLARISAARSSTKSF